MKYLAKTIIVLLIAIPIFALAQKKDSPKTDRKNQTITIDDNLKYQYQKPKFFDMIRYIPRNIVELGKYTIQKENLLTVGGALASTLAIIPLDQQITDGAVTLGSNFGWNDASYSKFLGLKIIPNDISSAIYQVGNGSTTLLLGGMFLAIGKIKNDYRALSTANQLVEVLLSVGVMTQTIKRITGRQSPFVASHPGGDWHLLPSIGDYQSDTPNYDAMPSGHLATFMATFTVISTNYPEIKWIKPVGYSLMGLLAFQMVSSEVHWTSDYPIALLIGYVIGKNTANRRIKKLSQLSAKPKKFQTNYTISNLRGNTLIGVRFTF